MANGHEPHFMFGIPPWDCKHGVRSTSRCFKCEADAKHATYVPRDKAFDYKELDPNGVDAKAPGAKLDAGKSPVRRGLLEYFPRACLEVAGLSADGAKKYSWGGWASVKDGVDRYGDAEVRHICKAAIEGPVDPDFKRLHATHEAWNALARLELILRERPPA